METQYQLIADPTLASLAAGNLVGRGVWTSLPLGTVGITNTITITADGLLPATFYQFR